MRITSRVKTLLRWLGVFIALALLVMAIWLLYEAMFILERFGLMAILMALAMFSGATLLLWCIAEGHLARTRTRIRHIVIGALLLGGIGVLHSIMSSDRLEAGVYAGLSFEGPVGFILGGNIAAMYSLLRLRGTSAV